MSLFDMLVIACRKRSYHFEQNKQYISDVALQAIYVAASHE